MLNSEKNIFLEAVKASGIEPAMFRFESATTEQFGITKHFQTDGLKMQFEGSDLWFVVFKVQHGTGNKQALFACNATHYDYVAEKYVMDGWLMLTSEYRVTDSQTSPIIVHVGPISSAREALTRWITNTIPKFVEEKSVPDLWQMAATGETITSLVGGEDTPFTKVERDQLTGAVAKLQEFVLVSFEHNEQQKKIINQRFDALKAALSNQGRTTWFTLALGTLATIGSTLYLTNEQGRLLLQFARQVFEEAVHYLR